MVDVKEDFKVSQVAKFFGISNDTVRLYDKMGILSPQNNDNSSHRKYSWTEFLSFELITQLRKMNFKLQDVNELINYGNIEKMASMLKEQEKLLDQQIAELQNARRLTKSYSNTVEEIINFEGNYEFIQSPTIISREVDDEIQEVRDEFMMLFPFHIPWLTFVVRKEVLEKSRSITREEYLQRFRANNRQYISVCTDGKLTGSGLLSGNEKVTIIPPTLCLHGYSRTELGEEAYLAGKVLEYIEERGYEAAGDFMCSMPAYFSSLGKDVYTYYEVWIPVRKVE